MSKPPVLQRQLDRCDVCGVKIHRFKLVRTQVEYLQPEAENHFAYSSYSAAGWTSSEAVDSYNSFGTHWDHTWVSVTADNTASILNGVATWAADTRLESAAVDVSSLTNVCVSFQVGPHHESTTPELTITAGYINSSDADVTLVTRTTSSQLRIYWTLPVSSLDATPSSVEFWIAVSASGDYWIDEIQLEDASVPGNFIATTGAAVAYAVETPLISVRKVCPRCWKPLLRTSAVFTDHVAQVEPGVPASMQEK